MSPWKGVAAGLALAAIFVVGVLYLFGVQFAAGDVYPEYSSLRSDPAGAKLLFDALARLPDTTATRNYLPLDSFDENGAAVVLLGLNADSFTADSELQLRVERLARKGNRVILAMGRMREPKVPRIGSLYRNWEIKFGVDFGRAHAHTLYFAVARDWRVLDRAGEKLLAIERGFDKGTVVLLAESDDFANQATVASDRLETVAEALGSYTRIVFDEQHFGISETGSIVGLARRFRLTGMALGLALFAALFLWRSSSGFPPPAAAAAVDRLSGRTSHAGLLTLLRRHVPPGELAAACWREWLSANRRNATGERIRRVEDILNDRAKTAVEALREVQAVVAPPERPPQRGPRPGLAAPQGAT